MNKFTVNNINSQNSLEGEVIISLSGVVLFSGHGYVIFQDDKFYHIELNRIGLFISLLSLYGDHFVQDEYILRNNKTTELYQIVKEHGYACIVGLKREEDVLITVSTNNTLQIFERDGNNAKVIEGFSNNNVETSVHTSYEDAHEEGYGDNITEEEFRDEEINSDVSINNSISLQRKDVSAQELISIIRERDNSRLIELAKMKSSREFSALLNSIQKAIPELTPDEYIYYVKTTVVIDSNRFNRSIAMTDYHRTHNLSAYKKDINFLISYFFSAEKCGHPYSIVEPYFNLLERDSIDTIIKNATRINNHSQLVDLTEKIKLNTIEKKVSWLLKLGTTEASVAAFAVIDSYGKNISMSNIKTMLAPLVGTPAYELFLDAFRNNIKVEDYGALTKEISRRNIQTKFRSKKREETNNTISKIGSAARCHVVGKTSHHYVLHMQGSSLRTLLPIKFCERQYEKGDSVKCKIVHVYQKKQTIIVGEYNAANLRGIIDEPLFYKGETIELRFILLRKELIAFPAGSNAYDITKIKVENYPSTYFNYKIKHQAIVTRVNSFFEYSVKLK